MLVQWIALFCTVVGVTMNCECFHCGLHCLVGAWWGCRVEAPSWRHTPWGCGHLVRGCQAWALGRPHAPSHNHLALWLAEAMACRHLAQGLPSLGRFEKTNVSGCNPRASRSPALRKPARQGLQPRAPSLQTHMLGSNTVAEVCSNCPWV